MNTNKDKAKQETGILYSKTCVKVPLKNRQNKHLNDKRQLNEGRKYCRICLKYQLVVFLSKAVLHRFYCSTNHFRALKKLRTALYSIDFAYNYMYITPISAWYSKQIRKT